MPKNKDKKGGLKLNRIVIEYGELEGGRSVIMVNGQPLVNRDTMFFFYAPVAGRKEGMVSRDTLYVTGGNPVDIGQGLAELLLSAVDPLVADSFIAHVNKKAEDQRMFDALKGGVKGEL